MKDLIKFIQFLFENPEIAGAVIIGVIGVFLMGICYKYFQSIKAVIGIGMVVIIFIGVILGWF